MMKPLILEGTEDTPAVHLDAATGTFSVTERSWPENAMEFYQPIIQWLEGYFEEPNAETVFEFQLEYFNTSSAKQIAKILLMLEKYSPKTHVTVRWHYEKGDIDMLTSGSRYAKLLNINYEFVEH